MEVINIALLILLVSAELVFVGIYRKYKRLASENEKLRKENAHLSAWQSVKYVPRYSEKVCNIDTLTAETRVDYRDLRDMNDRRYEYTLEVLAHELAKKLKDYITIEEVDNPCNDTLSKIISAEIKIIKPEAENENKQRF